MIIRESEIGENVKYWVRPDIQNRIKEGTIKSYFNSQVTLIEERFLTIQTPKEEVLIENDFVLAMTGYQPDFQFLRSIGVEIRDDEFQTPVHNPETMETNVKNVFLAGVICGGLKTNKWFIENSREHAITIINNLTERKSQEILT